MGSAGTQTSAIVFGGGEPPSSKGIAEQYNGTSWSSLPSMSTARSRLSGTGTQSSALATGGYLPPTSSSTEEWTTEIATAGSKTLTTS
jgi:hypothetical protein